jgi:hypothetical protein
MLDSTYDFVKPYALMTLGSLASKETLRGTIMRTGGVDKVITFMHHQDDGIRQEAARVLVNLS